MAPNPRSYNTLQRVITRAIRQWESISADNNPPVGATPEMMVYDALMQHRSLLEHTEEQDRHTNQCRGCNGCNKDIEAWWL